MKMSDKKNIDRLFQEKFKNFEVAPDDAVWKKIQARKSKDHKRVVIVPFWYRIAGIAALIAIVLSIGYVIIPDNITQNTIVDTEDLENKSPLPSEKHDNNNTIPNDALVDTPENQKSTLNDGASESTNVNNEAITDNLLKNQDKNNSAATISTDKNTSFSKTNNNQSITSAPDKENTINSNSSERMKDEDILFKSQKNTKDVVNNLQNNKSPETKKERISFTNYTEEIIAKNRVPENASDINNNKSENSAKENNPLFKNPTTINTPKEESIADNATPETLDNKENTSYIISNQNQDSEKKSIFDAIKEKEEKETAITLTKSDKRWNIAPNVAPVYYDSFGGSSIDPEFSDNSKQGQVNLSYGIQVAYSINKNLSVRSGVSKVDVAYNTEDVGFGIPSVASGVAGNNSATNIQSIIVSDYQDISNNLSPGPRDINDEILVKSQNPGLLNHSIGYIEVPLELKYSLTDSKIGIHMIGGVSTLFLEDDEVSIIVGNFKNQNVVREETVNDISFTGNIGIGFDYKLSDQFQINMEPIFKYQFNGFKDSAENFRPYYFGVYTGISFRF